MEKYVGKITKFLYKSDDGRFTLALFSLFENKNKTIVVSGSISFAKIGTIYEIEGEMYEDSIKKTKTLQISSIKPYIMSDRKSFVKYFNSSVFPGIGPNLAEDIADLILTKFKDNHLEKLSLNPEILKELTSLTAAHYAAIVKVLNTFDNILLNSELISYLEQTVDDENERDFILKNEFYEFAYKHDLGPFADVDEICLKYGVEELSDVRISWWAWNIIRQKIFTTGGTYVSLNFLKNELGKNFPDLSYEKIPEKLSYAKNREILFFKDKEKVYTQDSYLDEKHIAQELIKLRKAHNYIPKDFDFGVALEEVQKKVGANLGIEDFTYNSEQKLALDSMTKKTVQVITGGPGTGKTTVIMGIIEMCKILFSNMSENDIAVVAPTGRAASRIKESTGFNTTTIHKLLQYVGGTRFNVNDDFPIYKKILIIDESSMIDQNLFANLLRGVKGIVKLIMVGDVDQLPSVGYGNVFEDIIDSSAFEVSTLIKNNRQEDMGKKNGIIEIAKAIKNNTINELDFNSFSNLKLYEDENPEMLIKEVYNSHSSTNLINNLTNIQVVCPMNGGNYGVNGVNEVLQKYIINDTNLNVYNRNKIKYYETDKVICLRNNADKEIFNGDMGIIKEIVNGKKTIEHAVVQFGERLVKLSNQDFESIKHAYACTIHKTQGSEFTNIILVIDSNNKSNSFMINKKLLYTAVTRAKRNLYIFAKKDNFVRYSLKPAPRRETTLMQRIKEYELNN